MMLMPVLLLLLMAEVVRIKVVKRQNLYRNKIKCQEHRPNSWIKEELSPSESGRSDSLVPGRLRDYGLLLVQPQRWNRLGRGHGGHSTKHAFGYIKKKGKKERVNQLRTTNDDKNDEATILKSGMNGIVVDDDVDAYILLSRSGAL
ncbi:hypothetical protein M0804_001728 [Polistes exclamans]|nr:hypothetical protein M0804_001728 [Polistes exclamans]